MIKKLQIWGGFILVVGGLTALAAVTAFAPQDKGISETRDTAIDSVTMLPIRDARLAGVLHLLLTSDQRWKQLHVRARYTEYAYPAHASAPSAPQGTAASKTTFIEEINIHQPFEVTYRQFLAGESQPRYEIVLQNGRLEVPRSVQSATEAQTPTSRLSLTHLRRELALLPRTWQQIQPGMVIDHPLVRLIPARSMEMLFPTWIAQEATSQNRLFYEGEAQWLSRPVYHIRLEKPDGGTAVITAWVDQQTGILLRFRYEVNGAVLATYEVQAFHAQ